jgi:competence protein ComEC
LPARGPPHYARAHPRSRGGLSIALLVGILLGQIVGILAADAGWLDAPAAAKLAACGVALALASKTAPPRALAAALAIGAAAGFAHAVRLTEAAEARPTAPIEVTLEGTAVRVGRVLGAFEVDLADVRAADPSADPLPPRLRLRAPDPPDGSGGAPLSRVLPGDRIRARVRLRPFESRANPGGRDRERDLRRRGIGSVAALVHPDLVARRPDAEGWRPLATLHRFRRRAGERMAAEGAGGELLRGLALGERAGIGAEGLEAFRRLGLTHLLAVSGLNVAIVAAGLYRGARALRARWPRASTDLRRSALSAGAAGATAYALLAGWDVPVRRALVMLIGLALSLASRRPVRRGAPLLSAAVLILAAEPAALFDAGAQMSFAASAALVAGSRRRPSEAGERRLRGWLAELLHTSAAATAATAPVAAGAIGLLSPWGIAANVVAIPWTEGVLLPAAIVGALLAGFAPDARATGLALAASARVAALSLEFLEAAAARIPEAWVAQPSALALVASALAAAGVVLLRSTALRCLGALAICAGLALAPPAAIDPGPPRAVQLDVGQGDAAIVQGRSAALLIDGGPAVPGGPDLGAAVVLPALRALGVRRLDLVIASHADLDHRGGLPAVVRGLRVDRLWLPLGGGADPAFAALVDAARERGVEVEERGAGSAAEMLGDLRVEPLWPPAGARGARNDRSLVVRVGVGGRALLFPGDVERGAEAGLLAAGRALQSAALKLPHHGSRTSSSPELLAAVGGDVALVSAPRFSRFGMPHREVVTRAERAGYALWWTGRDGAVLIGLGPVLWVRGWR